jgi:hypothetical protein
VNFIDALNAAHSASSTVIERLRTAIPFVELANTDDEFMTERLLRQLMASRSRGTRIPQRWGIFERGEWRARQDSNLRPRA